MLILIRFDKICKVVPFQVNGSLTDSDMLKDYLLIQKDWTTSNVNGLNKLST